MRILVVATQIDVPGRGGGQTHVTELVRNLRRFGRPTLLLSRRDSLGADVVGVGLAKRLPPLGLAHLSSFMSLPASLMAARRFRPDVIYERGSSFGLGAYLSALLRIPMLVMLLDEHISPLSLMRAKRVITTEPKLVPPSFRHKTTKVSWGANTDLFRPIVDSLLLHDEYLLLADFQPYVDCCERAAEAYRAPDGWARMSILNTSRCGFFSSDRTIRQYCEEIWHVKPVPVS